MLKRLFSFSCFRYLFAQVALFFALSSACCASGPCVDVVVFSYNRPMQLYAFLKSFYQYTENYNEVHVIYRADDASYSTAYDVVAAKFAKAQFHKQGQTPKQDFKPLVLSSAFSKTSTAEYVAFGVDDIIITDSVDLTECVKSLEAYQGWGFFLRLGKNITECCMLNIKTPPPQPITTTDSLLVWDFSQGRGDWNYPNSVDMTIYKKQKIRNFLETGDYSNPNTLENLWHRQKNSNSSTKGVCFLHSKIVNIPLNVVNFWSKMKKIHYTTENLLKSFQEGMEIDISKFYKVNNPDAHMEYDVSFIQRATDPEFTN